MQLKLDDAGVRVAPGSARAEDDYIRDELERKAKKTRNALIGASAIFVVSFTFLGIAQTQKLPPEQCPLSNFFLGACFTGTGETMLVLFATVGSIGWTGVLVSGTMFGVQKGKLRRMKEAPYKTSRRVQWDLARAGLVF